MLPEDCRDHSLQDSQDPHYQETIRARELYSSFQHFLKQASHSIISLSQNRKQKEELLMSVCQDDEQDIDDSQSDHAVSEERIHSPPPLF